MAICKRLNTIDLRVIHLESLPVILNVVTIRATGASSLASRGRFFGRQDTLLLGTSARARSACKQPPAG
jgi:hypothetical protein